MDQESPEGKATGKEKQKRLINLLHRSCTHTLLVESIPRDYAQSIYRQAIP